MQLNNPERIVSGVAGGWPNGLRNEIATVHAKTLEKVNAAIAFYQSVTKPGMTTEARIARAVTLHEVFDAEARHSFA